jgi:hypothetical protein
VSDGEVVENEPRAASTASDDQPTPKRRSFLPRFGLRSLFVFAIVFCLFFGWIGRNAYRMRQEEAALEALERAATEIKFQADPVPGRIGYFRDPYEDAVGRLIGWKRGRSFSRSICLTTPEALAIRSSSRR